MFFTLSRANVNWLKSPFSAHQENPKLPEFRLINYWWWKRQKLILSPNPKEAKENSENFQRFRIPELNVWQWIIKYELARKC